MFCIAFWIIVIIKQQALLASHDLDLEDFLPKYHQKESVLYFLHQVIHYQIIQIPYWQNVRRFYLLIQHVYLTHEQ